MFMPYISGIRTPTDVSHLELGPKFPKAGSLLKYDYFIRIINSRFVH